jgi:hypothetical protein
MAIKTLGRSTKVLPQSPSINRTPPKQDPVIIATEKTQKKTQKAKIKAKTQNTFPTTLTSHQPPVVEIVTSSSRVGKSARKVKKTVNGPSFFDRVFSTENIQIGGLVLCSVAAAGAFGTWASKVGTMTASKIVVTNLIAFLQPGMTVVGFALKAGLYLTLNAVVPVASALVTISLPILSTVVVTTISTFVILHFLNNMIQKLEASVQSGMDKAREIPGQLLKQVPGYSTFSAMLESVSAMLGYGKDAPSEEQTEELIVVPQKNVTKHAPKDVVTRLDDLNPNVQPRAKREPFYSRQDFLKIKKALGE